MDCHFFAHYLRHRMVWTIMLGNHETSAVHLLPVQWIQVKKQIKDFLKTRSSWRGPCVISSDVSFEYWFQSKRSKAQHALKRRIVLTRIGDAYHLTKINKPKNPPKKEKRNTNNLFRSYHEIQDLKNKSEQRSSEGEKKFLKDIIPFPKEEFLIVSR